MSDLCPPPSTAGRLVARLACRPAPRLTCGDPRCCRRIATRPQHFRSSLPPIVPLLFRAAVRRDDRAMGMAEAEQRAAIEEHLPLVRHIVFQVAVHFPRHVDREELARAGALGLVEAARRYDGARGVPFPRFAAQRIRGAILDAVRSADWAPRSVRTMARSLEQTSQQLATDLGRSPTLYEIATAMATTPEQLTRLQERINRSVVLALDHASGEDGEDSATLGETIADVTTLEPSEALEQRELHAYLRDAVV